ncbi:hypothetical protein NEOLEDRAFT_1182475 [Neolentinus lepideus HHB14362 ss-1]|uniref:F-box domain-containing protein n=1 Tax=Neolentinus lepideus HHB14362 ss-1 TaxID=1314782 RepID=A0A165P4R1_9AGAM|nr:hypothetical protein NEOLEDRAFT_1182475 [Neolentinus lepideus HHB14362 ss-1]
MSATKSPLLTLPTELIESILIILAPSCVSAPALPSPVSSWPSSQHSSDPASSPPSSQPSQASSQTTSTFPSSLGNGDLTLRPESTLLLARTLLALSLTCRQLHRVLAAPPDGHLWREIYLGVWDDPRRALSLRSPTSIGISDIDWEDDFKVRIRAASYILSRTSHHPASSFSREAIETALNILLHVLHTAHPVPPSLSLPPCSNNAASWADFTPPPLQPHLMVHDHHIIEASSTRTVSSGEGEADGRLEWPLESRNVDWVRGVLEHGWPAEVGWRLVGGEPFEEAERLPDKDSSIHSGGNGEGKDDGNEDNDVGGSRKGKGKGKETKSKRTRKPETRSRSGVFDREFDESDIGQTFWRLVAYTGFLPVTPPPKGPPTPSPQDPSDEDEGDDGMRDLARVSDSEDSEDGQDSSEAQSARARRLARMRVYNLQYLRRERRWGPFLPVTPSAGPSSSKGKGKERARGEDEGDEEGGEEEGSGRRKRRRRRRGVGQPVMFLRSEEGADGERVLVLDTGMDGDDEGEDGDEEGGEEEGGNTDGRVVVRVRIGGGERDVLELEGELDESDDEENSHGEGREDESAGETGATQEGNEGDGDDSDSESDSSYDPSSRSSSTLAAPSYLPLLNLSPTPPPSRTPPALPRPMYLRPDWAYLASVRLVVEANLREAVGEGLVRGLGEVGGVRGRVFVRPEDGLGKEDGEEGREKQEGECGGWDWAGVEGAWRRCVCWMDYRDLILNNLHAPATRYSSPTLQEAMRIIPLQLHVSHYTTNPEFPERPDIHVEGQAAGPDHTMRRVWGVVGMIGTAENGEVRWNLVHCRRDGEQWQDEWAMEGVQVGGIGSALGVLGMWTGAEHERTDPLGA